MKRTKQKLPKDPNSFCLAHLQTHSSILRFEQKPLTYLELCVQAEQTWVVLNQPRLFGPIQKTDQQQQLLQSEA